MRSPAAAPDWRMGQKEQTRQRIIRAVTEAVAETGQVSVPDIARRSGVSPATIYRYFPNREALLNGAAFDHVDVGLQPGDPPISLRDYQRLIRKIFAAHENDLASVIAGHSTPAGRQMRQTRAANRTTVIREQLAAAGVDPASPSGRRLVAVTAVLGSSRSFLEFHETSELDTDEAADAVAWAIGAVIEATVNGRELDDFPSPAAQNGEATEA